MADISPEDIAFLAQLGFRSGDPGLQWRCLLRKGKVLLFFENSSEGLKRALDLYLPQKASGKALVCLLKKVTFFRTFLPLLEGSFEVGSPVMEVTNGNAPSLLFGNSLQKHRRAILSFRDEAEVVVKMGVGKLARLAVESEIEALEEFKSLPGVPGVKRSWRRKEWSAFSMVPLRSPTIRSIEEVVTLVSRWKDDEKVPLDSLSCWNSISGITEDGWGEHLANLNVIIRPTVRHGDLAPWNLMRAPEGCLQVIDWEGAKSRSVPGWDLVHFFLIRGSLVKGLSGQNLLNEVNLSLDSEKVMSYLSECGWTENHRDDLVASYLLMMRDELGEWSEILDLVGARRTRK